MTREFNPDQDLLQGIDLTTLTLYLEGMLEEEKAEKIRQLIETSPSFREAVEDLIEIRREVESPSHIPLAPKKLPPTLSRQLARELARGHSTRAKWLRDFFKSLIPPSQVLRPALATAMLLAISLVYYISRSPQAVDFADFGPIGPAALERTMGEASAEFQHPESAAFDGFSRAIEVSPGMPFRLPLPRFPEGEGEPSTLREVRVKAGSWHHDIRAKIPDSAGDMRLYVVTLDGEAPHVYYLELAGARSTATLPISAGRRGATVFVFSTPAGFRWTGVDTFEVR